jgi:hypothetical protein
MRPGRSREHDVPARSRRPWKALGLVVALAGCLLLGRASVSPHVTPLSVAAAAVPPRGSAPVARRLGAAPLPVPRLAQSPPPLAAACEPSDRRATATFLVGTVFRRLERPRGAATDVPEASANMVRTYIQGMADTVRQTSPAARSALAEEFTQRLCGEDLRDAELITMAYLALELPDIASSRGFDCVFSRRGKREDAVLWSMLDAWRHSGQEKTATIAEIERTAVDPRTQRRLLPRAAELLLRKAAAPAESE